MIAEDSYRDHNLLREIVRQTDRTIQVHIIASPTMLTTYVLNLQNAVPHGMLLNPSLQGVPVTEILSRLNARPEIRDIPLIVWGTESNPAIVEKITNAGATAYFVRPSAPSQIRKVMADIISCFSR